jgi:hypothetical protein
MPKRTIKDLLKLHGVTRDQLNAAKSNGVDIWNDEAVKTWLDTKRHRIKPGAEMSEEVGATQTLAEIEEAIKRATNIDDVKILKEKVLALKGITAVQQETKELVPAGMVREAATSCFSVVRAELLKLTSDLPPQLSGLGETKIQKVLRENIIEVLERLSDAQSKIFDDDEQS